MHARAETSSSKRQTVHPPTVGEIKDSISNLPNDLTADCLPENPVFKRLYQTLKTIYSLPSGPRGLTRGERVVLAETTESTLEYSESIKEKLETWVKNPATFWESESFSFSREQLNKQHTSDGRIRAFIQGSWKLEETVKVAKVVWVFNCVAVCLNFMRWKADWNLMKQIRMRHVDAFLTAFQCGQTEKQCKLTFSQIRSGQRQLKLLICLKRLMQKERLMEEEMSVEQYQHEDCTKLNSLGLLFLDQMPRLDEEKALTEEEEEALAQGLLNHGFSKWSATNHANDDASLLLTWASAVLWADPATIEIGHTTHPIPITSPDNTCSPLAGNEISGTSATRRPDTNRNDQSVSLPRIQPSANPNTLDDFASIALDTPCYLTQDSGYGTDMASQEATTTIGHDWNVLPSFPAAAQAQVLGQSNADAGQNFRPPRRRLPNHTPRTPSHQSGDLVLRNGSTIGVPFESNEVDLEEDQRRSKRQRTNSPGEGDLGVQSTIDGRHSGEDDLPIDQWAAELWQQTFDEWLES